MPAVPATEWPNDERAELCSGRPIFFVRRWRRWRAFLERVNALPRFGGVRGSRIVEQHFIVIDERPVPFFVFFVEFGGLEVAVGLFALELGDDFLCLGHPGVIGVKGHEVSESGDGLAGG